MNVLMAVVSDLRTDARVRREARALAEAGHRVRVVGFDYTVGRRTVRREAGVDFVLLPFPARGVSLTRRLAGAAVFFVRASREILADRPDVVHAHNLHLALPCLLAARRHRARLVYDAHELVTAMHLGWTGRVARRYERVVWRRADGFVTTNDSRARYLEELQGPPRPVVLGNYPEEPPALEPVDLRARLGLDPSTPLLVYQGGLYAAARCFDLVAAALARLPGWHWVIVGFGSERARAELEAVVAAAGVADRAHILPPVPVHELLALTATADIGVVPLRRTEMNYLGDTNKLFEYLMVGMPAVGSDFPELRRAILDNPVGPVGAVFDPADTESLLAALRRVADDLPVLKRRAWTVAREHFSWDREKEKLVTLYRGLDLPANGGHPAAPDRKALLTES